MSEDPKIETKKVRVTRLVHEHGYLASIALIQLEKAKTEQDGQKFRWLVPSMAFSVFRMESLCNLYGSQLYPHWDHFESTSFIGKIVMISDLLKVKVDFSAEPWQTINQMKSFRNQLAHSKPQKLSETHEVSESTPNIMLIPKAKRSILSYATVKNAERFDKVVDEIELIWLNNSRVLGFNVDISGVPIFEHL